MQQGTIAVVGVGYVGLPVSCALADAGFDVIGVDIARERNDKINHGICPILGDEPGLPEMLARVVREGRFHATDDHSEMRNADAIFVCVDTPIDQEKRPDLKVLKQACKSIGGNLRSRALVSIESTLPPLTMTKVVIPILEEESGLRAGKDIMLVHCPERVMPGRLLHDLRSYDRVIGGIDEASIEKGLYYYSKIVDGKLHATDLLSAEITKTIENAYRDVQIAFANEVALACEELGADAYEVRKLVNTCPFRDMHIPGAGVGGHCLPKDPWLFASSLKNEPQLIMKAREINGSMPFHMVELVKRALNEADIDITEASITILGLAFLRDSDDTRNSPSLVIIDSLENVRELRVHDPFVEKGFKVPLLRDLNDALTGSDCAVLVTDHTVYKDLDLDMVRKVMRHPIIVDGRNVLAASDAERKGFKYYGLGKGKR